MDKPWRRQVQVEQRCNFEPLIRQVRYDHNATVRLSLSTVWGGSVSAVTPILLAHSRSGADPAISLNSISSMSGSLGRIVSASHLLGTTLLPCPRQCGQADIHTRASGPGPSADTRRWGGVGPLCFAPHSNFSRRLVGESEESSSSSVQHCPG